MAISADTVRQYDPAVPPLFADLPMEASDTAYEGAAVTDSGGNGLVDGALVSGETFLGFVEKQAVETTAANGGRNVKVRQQGIIKNLAVTGVTGATDLGAAVYAADNGTFTLTSTSTYVQIGKVQAYVTTGYADVFFQAATVRSI
jgi:hypothetical protein